MIILSVATSGDPCSVAVTDERGLLAERAFRHRMHLSERLMDDVDAVLKDAGVALGEVDAYAVDLGPGSFTGVRIGVTAVKTWADLLSRPVAGIHALEASAYTLLGQHSDIVCPVIRARPGAVYSALYDGQEGSEIRPPEMLSGDELVAALKVWRVKRITLCAEGWSSAGELLGDAIGRIKAEVSFVRPRPLYASVFAEIARKRIAEGRTNTAMDLVPLYIAPPPIGPKAKRSAV
jgi:tRNA threonylcarbamoyladenosine biosynthesis protein TsaB